MRFVEKTFDADATPHNLPKGRGAELLQSTFSAEHAAKSYASEAAVIQGMSFRVVNIA